MVVKHPGYEIFVEKRRNKFVEQKHIKSLLISKWQHLNEGQLKWPSLNWIIGLLDSGTLSLTYTKINASVI